MDLLRLVLARQPVSKLIALGRLIQSPRFQASWINAHDFSLREVAKGSGIPQSSTTFGELSPQSTLYIPVKYLIYRSIFLRQWRAFHHLSNVESGGDSFWYAIESGVPEIQAFALANAHVSLDRDIQKFMHVTRGMIGAESEFGPQEDYPNASPRDFQRNEFLQGLGDASRIPWTPRIREVLTGFIGQLTQLSQRLLGESLPRIEGTLRIPRTFGDYEGPATIDYKIEFIKSILKEPTFEKNEEADRVYNTTPMYGPRTVLIASGYYFHIVEWLRAGRYEAAAILEVAFNLFAYDLIRYIIYGLKFEGVVTDKRSYAPPVGLDAVLCARRCLADLAILSHMDELLVTRYRVIAGDVLEDAEASLADRVSVYNPGPINSARDSVKIYGVQGLIAYDPKQILEHRYRNIPANYLIQFYDSAEYSIYLRGQGFVERHRRDGVLRFPDYPTDEEIARYPVLASVKQKLLEIRNYRNGLYQKILAELVNERR